MLATQCLLQRKSKNFRVNFDGRLQPGVTAKDMILALIGKIGTGGGTGHVFEFTGPAIRALDMDARMTICNMSIEGGARAGLVAPDDTTFQYVAGREFAPKGEDMGRSAGAMETASERRRRALRPERHDRCVGVGADDHVRHESRNGDSAHGPRAGAVNA